MTGSDGNEIFRKVLKVREPWFVEDVAATSDTVNVTVATRPGALVACPVCGKLYKIHDRIERTWKHTDVCDSECYIIAKMPRCDCPKCVVKQIDVPWARRNAEFTESFERKAMSLMERIGQGYPNTRNFITMIYFRHGRPDI